MPRSKQITKTLQELDIADSSFVVKFNRERGGLDVIVRYVARDEVGDVAEQADLSVNLAAQDNTDMQAILKRALARVMDDRGYTA